MDDRISHYLTSQKVCSLSNLLPDGSVHGAALHFSHSEEPLQLYFSVENSSRKCAGLLNGESVQAAVVVGFSEEEWLSLQLDGELQAVSDSEQLAKIQEIHYSKHPNSAKYKDEPETLFLLFTPKWWRYTDFKSDPWFILSSE